MPVYEYNCPDCGHRCDLLQPMDTERIADCDKCGAKSKRVFSSRIVVKYEGWGFDATDKLLPEASRSKRDFKQLKEKADQIMDGDYNPKSWE